MTRPQIHPAVFDITCIIALLFIVQSYPAGLHFHAAYTDLRQVGFPVSSAKKKKTPSPLRSSVQMELICVTGCQSSFKRETGSPISRDSVLSSCRRPQTATSVVGRCGRGLSLGGRGRPRQRSCSPPFQSILTAHSAPGDEEMPQDKGELLKEKRCCYLFLVTIRGQTRSKYLMVF